MNLSIRKFLFINLLLTLSVVTLIIVMGDYYSDQRKLELHSDNVLSQSALTTQALLESHFDRDALATRQQQLNHIPLSFYPLYNNYVNEGIQFQLWDKNGVLLLHSAQAPRVPLSKGNLGFSTQTIGNNTWRIFAIYDAKLD